MPESTMVAMPAPLEQIPDLRRAPGPTRFLHIAGKIAAGDRNGTRVLFQALRSTSRACTVTVHAQAASLPRPGRVARSVQYVPRLGNVADWRALYEGHDVLVMPRRYGGLCLPVIEAACAGLAIIMTECDPNGFYPATLIPASEVEEFKTPIGTVDSFEADPRRLAREMDRLSDEAALMEAKVRAVDWAVDWSWAQQRDRWSKHLAEACTTN